LVVSRARVVDPAITLVLRAWDVAKAFHGKAPELSLPSALRFSQPFGRLFLLFFVERECACPMTEAPAAQKEKAVFRLERVKPVRDFLRVLASY
jgi:hypothetical protein